MAAITEYRQRSTAPIGTQVKINNQVSGPAPPGSGKAVRTIFVSDIHLGCRHSCAQAFLKFLHTYHPEQLYLVGDFIDGWKLKKKWLWHPDYNAVLQRLLWMADHGTKLFYTPGNHDSFLRSFSLKLNCVEIADEFVHTTAGNKRLLVMHGDQFDRVEQEMPWMSFAAAFAYDVLLSTNNLMNRWAKGNKKNSYAFSASVKSRVKQLVRFVSDYEQRLLKHAHESDCNGVICGHSHAPNVSQLEDVIYYNTGDWVEHCTALFEYQDGQMELIHFDPDRQHARKAFVAHPHWQERMADAMRHSGIRPASPSQALMNSTT